MNNLDALKQKDAEYWAEFFASKNMCPYRFGSNRRGKWKTCPYPSMLHDECKKCWIEWLNMKARN